MKLIIDARDTIAGRLGSYVAKELLKGKEVVIINSEKAIISGSSQEIVERTKILIKKGGSSLKGPKIPRVSDRFLKRMMRGMLPWDRARGRQAWKRLRCYIGDTNIKIEPSNKIIKLENKKPMKYITIERLIELIK